MQLEQLLEAIRNIAKITEGYATLTDQNGIQIRTYDSSGREVVSLRGQYLEIAHQAAKSGKIQISNSPTVADSLFWAIPWENYVIVAGNNEKVRREKDLEIALLNALPFIARVVGGEAVVFNKEGMRIKSIDSAGNVNSKYVGTVSESAKEAMTKQKPTFGESISTEGALAVRIPITREFGLGFNNELTVKNEQRLFEEVKKFQSARYTLKDIIGESERITRVKNLCHTAAKASSILIYGETGTGKELFAQAIHNISERRNKPFIAINCGAIPASIIESYLFGYTGGAFTGAKKEGKKGAFEEANHGTIFLDEISEMPLDLQVKLLRVLQEREIMRIGEFKPIKLDIHIISSSNKDLLKAVNEGKFREDLYYRINVIEIRIPPLRERKEDIPLLVKSFINEFNTVLGKFVTDVDPEVIDILMAYDWRGNVRELKSCIERAMNLVERNKSQIKVHHLPSFLVEGVRQQGTSRGYIPTLKDHIQTAEIAAIKQALSLAGNSKKEAAELLDISTTTLWRKIKEYELE